MVQPLEDLTPDRLFDGGDLDCGSGLVLLIRESMLHVPVGGVLEMRSSEPTVRDDLPPWCRMVGHEFLGELAGDGFARYFVRRGERVEAEEQALAKDKEKAKDYEWRLRIRSTGHLQSTVYCRNFSWKVGQPASFEEKDANPSAVEHLLAALASDLCSGFATECAKSGLELDDLEISVRGRLNNILAHLGLEHGDPSLSAIELKCYASTFEAPEAVEAAWSRTVERSPVCATLRRAVEFTPKLAVV